MTKQKLTIQNRILFGLVGLLGVFAVGILVYAYSGSATTVVEHADNVNVQAPTLEPQAGVLGAYSSEPTYLDAGEWTRFNDIYADDLETEDDAWIGDDLTVLGALTGSGDNRLASLVMTGATTTFTASTTIAAPGNSLTAAQLCDQTLIPIVLGNTTTARLNIPATTTLFADCLTTDGDIVETQLWNTETVSTTILFVGSGGTLHMTSSTSATIAGGDILDLRIQRITANSYKAYLHGYND